MAHTNISLEQAIRSLGREAENLAEEALEPLGITPIQYDILETIARYMENPGKQSLMPARIAKAVQRKRKRGSREVLALKEKGYIHHAFGGSRLLTARGEETLADCRAALRPANQHMGQYFKDIGLEVIAEAFFTQQERAHEQ